ncbi:alcohol dehydrogenase catalytic domain-containing protein [Rhodoferax sp.]|uniref:alcohol dehydrogenase catalytic domain-containing protein n=1 Tax=Rhodoferax sp. TaxID=50421 RepID=UPI001EC32FDA|nr:alcohol dehydrogenase catalytic domain-containing protein [Rhodoferax sp.]MBT9505069.1 alcohol dehydrogenase catalytic domain-containing protein [Rhodoferax sp.]
MQAMTLARPGEPLRMTELPMPVPGEHDIVIRVLACGICRTDLHIIDGDLPPRVAGIVPGHEVVGRVVTAACRGGRFRIGDRVGIPWLGGTCGRCLYCMGHRENLCDTPVFTGYDRHGGFAQYASADERFCFALPDGYDDVHAAPLLCAGLIGYRAYRLCAVSGAMRLGLYGFGAVAQGQQVYAFTRAGDRQSQPFALHQANEAIAALRAGAINGAAVLLP